MKISCFKKRVRLIFSLFIVLTLVIIVRLYFLQIVKGEAFSEKADRQYVSVSVDTFDRGSILFQDKNNILFSAATLKSGYLVALNNRNIATDTDKYYKELSNIISIDSDTFYSKISKKDDPYEEIATHLSEEQVKKIKELNLPGLIIEKEKWRYYPGDNLASRLIGIVGYNGDKLEGRYGLEKYYEDVLSRKSSNLYVNTFAEIFSNLSDTLIKDKEREGNIVTSIDPEVQGYVEKVVNDTNNKWNSKITGAIVIDPKTGEIYSMTISPTFNLNDFKNEKDISIFANPLVSDAYEMGSIIKPLTVAAGLDTGDITAKTTYDDKGFLEMDGRTIYNYDKKGRGIIDMQAVLNNSLNTGVTFVMNRMGKEKFTEYFQKYGIGSETGIDLPSEASGNIGNILNNLNNNKKIEYATASFGQGISMTPIITVRALSVLANGGKLIIPHVVKKIDYKVGLSKNISYVNESKQIIKRETSEEISRMLVRVVDEALAGGDMKMKNYSIAAKTGTAQIARPANEGGGYYTDKWLHSFFGYFPAYNPKFLVFLYTVEPKNVDYASKTLTEPFFDIVKFLINYYEIQPDRNEK
ncbi:MAG: penicillin-binding protein 2 [Candidatus Pacebacteria bacterium]|nr:penicillin-binding protein 2 [Candidatus Paceibacterota bacterium]